MMGTKQSNKINSPLDRRTHKKMLVLKKQRVNFKDIF